MNSMKIWTIIGFLAFLTCEFGQGNTWEVSEAGNLKDRVVLQFGGLVIPNAVSVEVKSGGPAGCVNSTTWTEVKTVEETVDGKEVTIDQLEVYQKYQLTVTDLNSTDTQTVPAATSGDETTVPTAVSGLQVKTASASEITVQWDTYDCRKLPGKFDYFHLKAASNSGVAGETVTMESDRTDFTFKQLQPLELYTLGVAIRANERSATTEVQGCTGSEAGTGMESLSVKDSSYNTLKFTWTKPTQFGENHKLSLKCQSGDSKVHKIFRVNQLADDMIIVSKLKESRNYLCTAQITLDPVVCGSPHQISANTKPRVRFEVSKIEGDDDTLRYSVSGSFQHLHLTVLEGDQSCRVTESTCSLPGSVRVVVIDQDTCPGIPDLNATELATICFNATKTFGNATDSSLKNFIHFGVEEFEPIIVEEMVSHPALGPVIGMGVAIWIVALVMILVWYRAGLDDKKLDVLLGEADGEPLMEMEELVGSDGDVEVEEDGDIEAEEDEGDEAEEEEDAETEDDEGSELSGESEEDDEGSDWDNMDGSSEEGAAGGYVEHPAVVPNEDGRGFMLYGVPENAKILILGDATQEEIDSGQLSLDVDTTKFKRLPDIDQV